MNTGQYTSFYVRRKKDLFPLIEKYANIKIKKGITHGELIPLYQRLLRTDPSFRAEVDNLINGSFKNAGGFIGTLTTAVGNIFGNIKATKEAKLESDKLFYETILNEQKKDDTVKILVVSAVALAFMGLGIYLVVHKKS